MINVDQWFLLNVVCSKILIYFFGLQDAGLPQPLAINIMREPIAREVSAFYYLMWGPRQEADMARSRRKFQRLTKLEHPPTINEYIEWSQTQSAAGSCLQSGNMQTRYFCGFDPVCEDICSEGALTRAMRVLHENYAVVGILEHFNSTLHLLELELPDWFTGLRSEYARLLERSTRGHLRTHSPQHHESPTEASMVVLRQHHSQDVKLYQYARAVFLKKGHAHGFDFSLKG